MRLMNIALPAVQPHGAFAHCRAEMWHGWRLMLASDIVSMNRKALLQVLQALYELANESA